MTNMNKASDAYKIIQMSAETKVRLTDAAEKLKDRELFAHKIEDAKKTLSKIKSLPI